MPKPTRTTDRRMLPNNTLIPHKGGVPLPPPKPQAPQPPKDAK